MDNLNVRIFNEQLVYRLQDPKNISRAMRLKYSAEIVVYLVKGKVIRHMACETIRQKTMKQ